MICKKVASGITAIKCVRNFVPRETLLTIFRALLQPRFKYCSTVWANCNKGLQKLQKRAARIITSLNYDASLDDLLQLLNQHKFELQRRVDLSILMYKGLNNETPEYLSSKFIFYVWTQGYIT